MPHYPTPELHDCLLPVIACLPTAFFSERPPPALVPLLTPILRQRLSLYSSSSSSAQKPSAGLPRDTWLNYLTWSSSRAERLNEICAGLQLEPHPVSGELELFEDEEDGEGVVEYRRLDPETFQAKCDIRKLDLAVIWTWCINDAGTVGLDNVDGQGTSMPQDSWRVAEVRPLETTGEADDMRRQDPAFQWHATQDNAEEVFCSIYRTSSPTDTRQVNGAKTTNGNNTSGAAQQAEIEADDDSSYWAAYDMTPAQTPAVSSASTSRPHVNGSAADLRHRQPSTDELEYFARYGSEVQPALDAHDPDEEEGTTGLESSLRPQSRKDIPSQASNITNHNPPTQFNTSTARQSHDFSLPLGTSSTFPPQQLPDDPNAEIHSPQPSRPASPVTRLENSAVATTSAEFGVKQHISTEIKSLYRLARAAGIEREEFERVVGRELDVLGLMDFE